jgi:hypothetical protein
MMHIYYVSIYMSIVAKVEMQTQRTKILAKMTNFECMCTKRQNSWACVCVF